MRPGTKIRMWSPRVKNRPDVEAPGLLRAASAISIFSVIGMLVYAVAQSITTVNIEPDGVRAAYVALLHFVLPFVAFYTITTNSPLSRTVIVTYVVILSSATIAGKGFLGELPYDPIYKALIAAAVLVVILIWLYGSPKMRFYYAAVSDKPIPSDLIAREVELQHVTRLSPRARATIDWFLDHLQTIVLLGFIVTAVYAFVSTS